MKELLRILVADDEELERRIIGETLERNLKADDKYRAVIYLARDGSEALAIASKEDITASFLDVRMPGVNGLQVAEKIVAQKPDAAFTFISAYGDYPMLRAALRLHARDYLLKPVRRQDIVTALWKMVNPSTELHCCSDDLKQYADDGAFWQPLTPTKQTINAAKSYVRQKLAEQFTMEEVAAHVGFSFSYFSSLFSKEENVTFKEYVTQVRIDRAKALLEMTCLPLKHIARETGFGDPNYFSKVFKQQVGLTPSQFRVREGKIAGWDKIKSRGEKI